MYLTQKVQRLSMIALIFEGLIAGFGFIIFGLFVRFTNWTLRAALALEEVPLEVTEQEGWVMVLLIYPLIILSALFLPFFIANLLVFLSMLRNRDIFTKLRRRYRYQMVIGTLYLMLGAAGYTFIFPLIAVVIGILYILSGSDGLKNIKLSDN